MRLGKYEVLGPIGIGGFGRVWLARDSESPQQSSQLVAIKRLRRARIRRTKSTDEIAKYEAALKYEAEIGSYLVHPNVVRVIELTRVGKDHLLVMEFVNGLGLDELMGQRRQKDLAMPPDIALEIAIQTGQGLHYAHTACGPDGTPLHIVHRDIKPSNIMISRTGVVRVMDFGVARSALPRIQTTTGTIKGTLRYLSPEQAQGVRNIGPETDQFALGLVLGEMLIGRPVYEAEHDHQILLKALRGQVGAAIEEADRVCPGIGALLKRALAHTPEERYPSVGAFVDALRQVTPPLQALVGLAEWVHRGLEERARLAVESPDNAFNPDNGRPDADSSESLKVSLGSSEGFPLGWAHEQLAVDELEEQAGAAARKADVLDEANFGRERVSEWGDGQAAIAREMQDSEGWAMMPSASDEFDLNLLQRVPAEVDWSHPISKSDPDQKRRRKTELLSKPRGANNNESGQLPPYSPTAYNVNRPGRDRIRSKLKNSAVAAGVPRTRVRSISASSSFSAATAGTEEKSYRTGNRTISGGYSRHASTGSVKVGNIRNHLDPATGTPTSISATGAQLVTVEQMETEQARQESGGPPRMSKTGQVEGEMSGTGKSSSAPEMTPADVPTKNRMGAAGDQKRGLRGLLDKLVKTRRG